ncbi:MAG: pilus assembly protein [Robiginitomaculum sp.]|nr:pilus assembly protein [Robiginitomaculum sp.]
MFALFNSTRNNLKRPNIIRDEQGTTAIEFAILGVPFLALLFGIVELAMIFFISSTTQHALESSAREIRTGELLGAGQGLAELKTNICTEMTTVGDCDNLRIDIVSTNTGKFTDLSLATSPTPTVCTGTAQEISDCEDAAAAAAPVMPADVWTCTSGGDVVMIRIQYVHTLSVPSALTKLANSTGNTRIISHTTAFKNEPFSTACTP